MMINHKNGRLGEDIAAEFYEANGYKILERNRREGHLETDLIAENFESVAFVEVKTRTDSPSVLKYGAPRTAVNRAKQERLIEAAKIYLSEHNISKKPRMDVVEIYLDTDGAFKKMTYIRNAFMQRSEDKQ